jgi:predicted amidophosphoribosyltransferase
VTALTLGAALAVGAALWVVAPIFRAVTPGAARGSDAPREGERACASCGARPEPEARFCSNCGRPLDA